MRNALKVSGTIFLLVAAIHFLRVVFRVPVTIRGEELPLWTSVIGSLVSSLMALWMFHSLKK